MRRVTLKFRSFRTKITIILILSMLLIGAVNVLLICEFARKSQFKQLQDKLMMIARIATLMMDSELLLQVPLNEEGLNTPQYKMIAERLRKIRETNPSLKYIYTMAKTDKEGVLQFIVDPDAGEEEEEFTSYPGDKYNAAPFPALLKAFECPSVDEKITADQWGMLLSGYAPVRDKNGKAIAVLGVDMSADDVYAIQKEINRRAVLVLSLSILLSIVIGILISRKVSQPITELAEGTRHIAGGDLQYRVKVRGFDEIGALAASFNNMASDLKEYMEELKRTTAAKERIESELKVAHEIQTSMLPRIFPPFPQRREFDIFAAMDAAKEVGGDLYDFFFTAKNKLCFLIGDVSGKGVPAALFMAISKALFKTEALRGLSPDEILTRVNNILAPDNDACMFVTVLCVILNTDTGQLQFSNGGHNPPLIYSDDGSLEFVSLPKGFVVGAIPDAKFESKSLRLKPNDILFLYTDGVTEAMNPQKQLFSEERLKMCLLNLKNKEITDLIRGVREDIKNFAEGFSQSDDITMLALKYNG